MRGLGTGRRSFLRGTGVEHGELSHQLFELAVLQTGSLAGQVLGLLDSEFQIDLFFLRARNISPQRFLLQPGCSKAFLLLR